MTVSDSAPAGSNLTSDPERLPSTAEIDRSCRGPVLFMFAMAAVWLFCGVLFGLLSAIKAHAPGFLAGPELLTYGRVRPFSSNAIAYGFALQSGLGMALWMFCRLGRNLVEGGWAIITAAALWNLGLLAGLILILFGGSTGYEWLEVPGPATSILFVGYVVLGVGAMLTFHRRSERNLYVSQWFLLTAILWFPWIFSTAQLLLVHLPVRGMMQAIVSGWYGHNFLELCLGSFGLAAIFYILPQRLGRPLQSHYIALFGFWMLVVFGSWGGLQRGEPAPNWISSVSVVARVLLLVPVLAFALSWHGTLRGRRESIRSDIVMRFVAAGAFSYLLAAALAILGALPVINRAVVFTLYEQGLAQLRLHGFLALVLSGALYHIIPRLARREWPSAGLVKLHFWCAFIGMLMASLPLVVGGMIHGMRINQPELDFIRVSRGTIPFLGANSMGMSLLVVGYAAFLLNCGRLLAGCCSGLPIWPIRTADSAAVKGVKS
jgi:cytochrome c oxidase cbb3-type subunit I